MVDPAFTSEKPSLNDPSDISGKLSSDAQKKFEGFTFIPDNEKK